MHIAFIILVILIIKIIINVVFVDKNRDQRDAKAEEKSPTMYRVPVEEDDTVDDLINQDEEDDHGDPCNLRG